MSRPTMDDVAERAGVSRSLVSLVMRKSDRVSDTSRRKVLAAAEELGYRPNLMARNLARNRTHVIGLLLDDLHNPFYADAADGVFQRADERGYRVIMSAGFRDGEVERVAIETFLEFQVDGMVLASPRCALTHIETAAKLSPVAALGDEINIAGVSSIYNDDTAGSALAIGHLVTLGHRSITHVQGGSRPSATARAEGYATSMRNCGLGDFVQILDGEFTEAAGVEAANTLVASGELPDAVFAANDLVAAGLMGRFQELGVSVPKDVSVIGYDNTEFSALRHLSITTINQPRNLMGTLAVDAIADRIEAGQTEGRSTAGRSKMVAPDLIVRSTTAAPRRLHTQTVSANRGS